MSHQEALRRCGGIFWLSALLPQDESVAASVRTGAMLVLATITGGSGETAKALVASHGAVPLLRMCRRGDTDAKSKLYAIQSLRNCAASNRGLTVMAEARDGPSALAEIVGSLGTDTTLDDPTRTLAKVLATQLTSAGNMWRGAQRREDLALTQIVTWTLNTMAAAFMVGSRW